MRPHTPRQILVFAVVILGSVALAWVIVDEIDKAKEPALDQPTLESPTVATGSAPLEGPGPEKNSTGVPEAGSGSVSRLREDGAAISRASIPDQPQGSVSPDGVDALQIEDGVETALNMVNEMLGDQELVDWQRAEILDVLQEYVTQYCAVSRKMSSARSSPEIVYLLEERDRLKIDRDRRIRLVLSPGQNERYLPLFSIE